MTKDILSFDEFVAYCNISRSKGYKATSQRELPHFKPRGGKIYFKMEDVKKWLLQNRVPSADELNQQ